MPAPAPEEIEAIAAAVRGVRARRGLTQEAAGLAGGLGRKYLGDLERGRLIPTVRGLAGVARGFEMPLSELLRALADGLESAGR